MAELTVESGPLSGQTLTFTEDTTFLVGSGEGCSLRLKTPGIADQHLVINGASDLLHKIFGKEDDGYHARSAVGFAALPTGAAVEIEAIFEVKE